MTTNGSSVHQNETSSTKIWVWDFAREIQDFGANIDYLASAPATGGEYLSDIPIDAAIRPIYRSQNALRRFKALHSPPIGSPPIVDNPWKKIILEFVSKDRVQFLSIRLIARGEICDDYFTLITFDRVRAVDLEKSDVTRKIEKPGITYVRGMKNIVLKENGLKGLHLARDEQSDHLLVSDELKRALSATGQDSVFYRPEDVITFEKLFATR